MNWRSQTGLSGAVFSEFGWKKIRPKIKQWETETDGRMWNPQYCAIWLGMIPLKCPWVHSLSFFSMTFGCWHRLLWVWHEPSLVHLVHTYVKRDKEDKQESVLARATLMKKALRWCFVKENLNSRQLKGHSSAWAEGTYLFYLKRDNWTICKKWWQTQKSSW